jgi:hygromycin-B 7''-O-kinase
LLNNEPSKEIRRMLLPEVETYEDYRPIYRDAGVWLPAMRVICQRHGLDASQLEFAPPGTHVVFKAGTDRYVKLFAPPWRGDFTPERLVLHKLSEQPDLPIPRPVAEGEVEGWPYIIVTVVKGVPLNEVWGSMAMPDRERIAARCGELMARLHTTPTDGLEAIAVDWPAFVERQIRTCIDQIAQTGLDGRWTGEITKFFTGLPPLFEPGFQPVLLSADVTDEHVLVSLRDGKWDMTGYIDFGDAMLGHPHYEFAAPGCCITHGSPRLQRAMALAYGYGEDQLNADLADRLMAYALIHRYINVPELLEMLDLPQSVGLDHIKRVLWSFSNELK